MQWSEQFHPSPLDEQSALPQLALVNLDQYKAITLVGEDASSYLQGQITCDVTSLDREQSTLGAHCDAKGKVWSVFRLFHHQAGLAMVQDADGLATELTEIKKYAVFSKVTIEESQHIVMGLMGQNVQDFIDAQTETRADVRSVLGGTAVKIDSQRWMLLVEPEHLEHYLNAVETKFTASIWDRFDIEAGLPRLPKSQQNQHIPQALNLHLLGAISFTKGCYTGQEIVARAKYRGINKRALYPVKTTGTLQASSSLTLERQVGENWRGAGELLIHYRFETQGAIGLVVLPNNLEQDTRLRLAEQPELEWSIMDLPYSLTEE
ncbi:MULTISPECIES: tRNA-modifying protein YgfZ [unclassified Vibrio]|uniref:tRNA-modifying protein YgfZ n=1 Tax=Vibrio sp. HB236076 TaxID=3232307 RepID=A0AB39HF16_9VIBR|nr:tRNA-modifying protein YgfZ [Vibrio sp. HB161653]MDP5253944.1 tRNA-modifying protein YgfZ [Vibrio sp. HB161653]